MVAVGLAAEGADAGHSSLFGPFGGDETDLFGGVDAVAKLRVALFDAFPDCHGMFLEEKARELAARPDDDLDRFLQKMEEENEGRTDTEHFSHSAVVSAASANARRVESFLRDVVGRNLCPRFLRESSVGFGANREDRSLLLWLESIIETRFADHPSREEYEMRYRYTTAIDLFLLRVTPRDVLSLPENPRDVFSSVDRSPSRDYKLSAYYCLKREFGRVPAEVIRGTLTAFSFRCYPSYASLSNYHGPPRPTPRGQPNFQNLPSLPDRELLRELWYCRHEGAAESILTRRKKMIAEETEALGRLNLLQACEVCFDTNLLPDSIARCPGGHAFCHDCVLEASRVAIGEGKLELTCLGSCEASFSPHSLKKALPVELFDKWFRSIQTSDIEKALARELAKCPSCSYAEDIEVAKKFCRIFICKNPKCGKRTCRFCGAKEHIPFTCAEMGQDLRSKEKKMLQDALMTESLLRTCKGCGKPFYKLQGCNRMTCVCGHVMCYLCSQSINNGYEHFWPTPFRFGRKGCPLFSDNTKLMTDALNDGKAKANKIWEQRRSGKDEEDFNTVQEDEDLLGPDEHISTCRIL